MPRFKTPDYGLKMIPVDFAQQVLPGTFEFALCHLVDNELDLSTLRSRYTNDTGGAPAFDPAVLLKIVLLAYSRGLLSSRSIAGACRHNVLFMAVSGDSAPHFTTIAGFVAELGDEAAALFTQVLLVCDRQGLIGRELFAIDGVKLPSNASKAKSGTRADFEREAAKMEAAVQRMMGEQKARDLSGCDDDEARAARTRERLTDEATKIRDWLAANPDERRGAKFTEAQDCSHCLRPAGTGCIATAATARSTATPLPCAERHRCLRTPDKTRVRTVRAELDQFLMLASAPPVKTSGYKLKVMVRDGENTEHFWVTPFRREPDGFAGTLANDPRVVRNAPFSHPSCQTQGVMWW